MGNLITFCKESQATYVAQGLPKPFASVKHMRKVSADVEPVKEPPRNPPTRAYAVDKGNQALLDGILKGTVEGSKPVKVSYPMTTTTRVSTYAMVPTSHLGVSLYEKFADQTGAIHHELIRAALTGNPPDKDFIDAAMLARGDAEPAFDIPIRVVKRGGTLEDLFNKYRNVPHETLFTRDIDHLFENSFERDVQLARAKKWSESVSQFNPP